MPNPKSRSEIEAEIKAASEVDGITEEEFLKKVEDALAAQEKELQNPSDLDPGLSSDQEFEFTAFVTVKKYVKVRAGNEREAFSNLLDMELGDILLNEKDVRWDKKEKINT